MKTKQENWTSSDSRISVTITNRGGGLLASLTVDGRTYNGFVASILFGHHVIFFPYLGQHGQWAVPYLYNITDEFGHRFQWLYAPDRYRRAVEELEWAVKNCEK